MQKKYLIYGAIGILVLGGLGFGYYLFISTDNKEQAVFDSTTILTTDDLTGTGNDAGYITPEIIEDNSIRTLIGTVVSNEVATVFPRRDGVITDFYVDIGDTIRKDQTIGIMLPPGVEGESNAAIVTKQLALQEAQNSLAFARQKAQQVVEKALLDQDIQGDKNTIVGVNRAKIEEMKIAIENKQQELEQMILTQESIIEDLEYNLAQTIDQIGPTVEGFIKNMDHTLLGISHNKARLGPMNLNDVKVEYSAKDVDLQSKTISSYNKIVGLYRNLDSESKEEALVLLGEIEILAKDFTNALQSSITSPNFPRELIQEATNVALNSQQQTKKQQEMIQNITNMIKTTTQKQKQDQVSMENSIENMIQSVESFVTNLFASQSSTDKQVNLTKAEQDLMVQQYQNAVTIAQAQLDEAYAKLGNIAIKSPFGGVVAERMVDVGDVISMKTALLNLVDVKTSLAKKSKKEIEFGLPEELFGSISVGDVVTYNTPSDEFRNMTGTISRISPQVDSETNTYTTKVDVSGSAVAHNSRANILIPTTSKVVYRIPKAYLSNTGTRKTITILEGENNERITISITVLAEDGEFIDFQGPIEETTRIIQK